MKSDELVRRINNGEIKDGTKIKSTSKDYTVDIVTLCGRTLKNDNGDYIIANLFFIEDAEFEIVEEHKGWFKPKMGEQYAVIDEEGDIYYNLWGNNKTDWHLFSNQNCFRDEEDAQEYLDYKNALKEAEKPFEKGKCNYCFCLDTSENRLTTDSNSIFKRQGNIYFGADESKVQAFIDKWEKQILKYEFGIFE